MAEESRRLSLREIGHVIGRCLAAVGIGWAYLGLVSVVDFGGWASWIRTAPIGALVRAELLALVTVVFGAVGLHIGLSNVMGDRLRVQRARLSQRRAAMRRWEKY